LFDIDAALRYVVKKEGSDLHVKVDERLAVGVRGMDRTHEVAASSSRGAGSWCAKTQT
jgi:hypothetical protein